MQSKRKYHPVVEELVKMIETNNWKPHFEKAIATAHAKNVTMIGYVKGL